MSRLTWSDLLIEDLNADACRQWLGHWSWLIGGRLAPIFLNTFGSWFIRRPEGPVEFLDVLTGTVEQVAGSYEEFIRLVNGPPWQEIYLLSQLVFELHGQGKVPGPGQCYALTPHPALGGPNPVCGDSIDPQFVMIMDIGVWQSLCGQLLQPQSGTDAQTGETSERP